MAQFPKKKGPGISKTELVWITGLIASLLMICLIVTLCSSCNPIEQLDDKLGVKDDNIIEETVEFGIKAETGIDIDLTPRSPEHGDPAKKVQ